MKLNKLINIPMTLVNKIQFIIYPTIFEGNYKISGKLYRRGKGQVIIGEGSIINSSRYANCVGGTYTTLCAYSGATLRLGKSVGISNATIIARAGVTIDDFTLIGAGTRIYDNDFHSLDSEQRGTINDVPKSIPIYIGKNVFIGAYSLILKGVTIGDKSIIGAGSVVTKNVPPNEIWAGNPARFIKKI